jgi:hypothetical protein
MCCVGNLCSGVKPSPESAPSSSHSLRDSCSLYSRKATTNGLPCFASFSCVCTQNITCPGKGGRPNPPPVDSVSDVHPNMTTAEDIATHRHHATGILIRSHTMKIQHHVLTRPVTDPMDSRSLTIWHLFNFRVRAKFLAFSRNEVFGRDGCLFRGSGRGQAGAKGLVACFVGFGARHCVTEVMLATENAVPSSCSSCSSCKW